MKRKLVWVAVGVVAIVVLLGGVGGGAGQLPFVLMLLLCPLLHLFGGHGHRGHAPRGESPADAAAARPPRRARSGGARAAVLTREGGP